MLALTDRTSASPTQRESITKGFMQGCDTQSYNPKWAKALGSLESAVLLKQIVAWVIHAYKGHEPYEPFYKKMRGEGPGGSWDDWVSDQGFTSYNSFKTALRRIATKTTTSGRERDGQGNIRTHTRISIYDICRHQFAEFDDDGKMLNAQYLVWYCLDNKGMSHFGLNEPLLFSFMLTVSGSKAWQTPATPEPMPEPEKIVNELPVEIPEPNQDLGEAQVEVKVNDDKEEVTIEVSQKEAATDSKQQLPTTVKKAIDKVFSAHGFWQQFGVPALEKMALSQMKIPRADRTPRCLLTQIEDYLSDQNNNCPTQAQPVKYNAPEQTPEKSDADYKPAKVTDKATALTNLDSIKAILGRKSERKQE